MSNLHKKIFVVGCCFLLVLQCPVEREIALVLGNALQNQIELLRSRGFNPIRVHTDPQSAFRTLTTKFKNVVIDTGGECCHGNYHLFR
jgi:hypothetical protein